MVCASGCREGAQGDWEVVKGLLCASAISFLPAPPPPPPLWEERYRGLVKTPGLALFVSVVKISEWLGFLLLNEKRPEDWATGGRESNLDRKAKCLQDSTLWCLRHGVAQRIFLHSAIT